MGVDMTASKGLTAPVKTVVSTPVKIWFVRVFSGYQQLENNGPIHSDPYALVER